MKTFFQSLLTIIETMGKARAASALVRMGRVDDAKKLMLD